MSSCVRDVSKRRILVITCFTLDSGRPQGRGSAMSRTKTGEGPPGVLERRRGDRGGPRRFVGDRGHWVEWELGGLIALRAAEKWREEFRPLVRFLAVVERGHDPRSEHGGYRCGQCHTFEPHMANEDCESDGWQQGYRAEDGTDSGQYSAAGGHAYGGAVGWQTSSGERQRVFAKVRKSRARTASQVRGKGSTVEAQLSRRRVRP